MNWRDYQVDIPEGEYANWKVERFEVSEEEAKFHNLRCALNPRLRYRTIVPGTYTRLCRPGIFGPEPIMSDTPAEIHDLREVIARAKGQVLINGLGLGVVVSAVLEKHDPNLLHTVDHVTVIEINEDVIKLVGDSLSAKYGDRLTIVCADALEYTPLRGSRYDVVWHDIWDNICGDNWESMSKLHRKYGRRCGWQGSWCREEVRQVR